jgi:hypothetical protein
MLELAAIALCSIAGFAQWRVGAFTATPTRAWVTRAFLAALGAAVGVVMMRYAQPGDAVAWLVIGFGLVHVPPAIVLLLKGLRGEQPS